MPANALKTGVLLCVVAIALAGCSTSNTAPATVDGLRRVVGTELIGARGKTPADQERIDSTAAGLCGAHIWSRSECARHGKLSRGAD